MRERCKTTAEYKVWPGPACTKPCLIPMKKNAGCLSSVASVCTDYCLDHRCGSVAWVCICFLIPWKEMTKCPRVYRAAQMNMNFFEKLASHSHTHTPRGNAAHPIGSNATQSNFLEESAIFFHCLWWKFKLQLIDTIRIMQFSAGSVDRSSHFAESHITFSAKFLVPTWNRLWGQTVFHSGLQESSLAWIIIPQNSLGIWKN